MKCCCFTGYRPGKFDFPLARNDKKYMHFENELVKVIGKAVEDGYDTFYCGGAMGFDILAAEIVLIYKRRAELSLIMALPYPEQNEKYSEEWCLRYDRVLKEASQTVYVSDKYFPYCYEKRNRYMVDRSQRVIAFYDGKKGGTLNTLRYAKSLGREIINISCLPGEQLTYYEILQ